MGLFSFLKKSPEKLEAAGDAYMDAKDFGGAKLEYESALSLIERKHADNTDLLQRVKQKLTHSKESLARKHLASGDDLVDVNAMDEAERLFSLALTLTEDPELQKALKDRIGLTVKVTPHDEPADDTNGPEGEPEIPDEDHQLEVLCMTMPDDMAEAYMSYGDTFKEGYLALSRGDFIRAADKLRLALKEHEDENTHIPVELATAHYNLWQPEPAIELLTGYLQSYPASYQGISLLCDVYCDLRQHEFAREVINELPEIVRTSLEIVRLKGRIYHQEGDYDNAEAVFRDALKTSEWDMDVARELAMTLEAAGKTEEALEIYTGILNECTQCHQRINPLDKKAYADLSFRLNDFSDKVLDIYLNLGKDYPVLRKDCYEKACTIFSHHGNHKEAARFRKMAEQAG